MVLKRDESWNKDLKQLNVCLHNVGIASCGVDYNSTKKKVNQYDNELQGAFTNNWKVTRIIFMRDKLEIEPYFQQTSKHNKLSKE